MNATEFKEAFAEKTHVAFTDGTTFGNKKDVCDGEDWARALRSVLTQMDGSDGRESPSSSLQNDLSEFCICTNGNEEASSQVHIVQAVLPEEYNHGGTQAILKRCDNAQTSAPLRVAIGYSGILGHPLSHRKSKARELGESLLKDYRRPKTDMSLKSELLLIVGWYYYYGEDIGWHTWLLPRSDVWREELGAAASPA